MSDSLEPAPLMRAEQTFESVTNEILNLLTRDLDFQVGLSIVRKINLLTSMNPYPYPGYNPYGLDGIYDQSTEDLGLVVDHGDATSASSTSYISSSDYAQGELATPGQRVDSIHTPVAGLFDHHPNYLQPSSHPSTSRTIDPAIGYQNQYQDYSSQPPAGPAARQPSYYSAPATPAATVAYNVLHPYPQQPAYFPPHVAASSGARLAHIHPVPQANVWVSPTSTNNPTSQHPPNRRLHSSHLQHMGKSATFVYHSAANAGGFDDEPAADVGDFDNGSSDVEVIESPLPLHNFSIRGLQHKRILSTAELKFALENTKDGDPVGLWESLRMAQVIFGPEAPNDRYLEVLKPPKTPTSSAGLRSVWKIVNKYCCGGGRSTHLVVKHFWTDHTAYKNIEKLDKHTGGDGDGEIDSDAGLLEKLRLKISSAKAAGLFQENLSAEAVLAWKKDSVGGIFALYASKLMGSKNAHHDVEESRDGQPSTSRTSVSSVKHEQEPRPQAHRKASTPSLTGVHSASASSADPSSGPIRTNFFTRGAATTTSSPVTTHSRTAPRTQSRKGGKKSSSQASQIGGSKQVSELIITNQEEKRELLQMRKDREEATMSFLHTAGTISQQVKAAEARAIKVDATATAVVKLNETVKNNVKELVAQLEIQREKAEKLGNADRVETIDERILDLLSAENFDVHLSKSFAQVLDRDRDIRNPHGEGET